MSQPLTPDPQRMIARYQQELAEANDRSVRYASLADALAEQVQSLRAQVADLKAELEKEKNGAPV